MNAKNVIAALIIIIVMFTVYLAYHGLFSGVTVQEVKKGPWVFVYDKHNGPYKGVKKVADRIYRSLLKDEKIETIRGFGIYYDKPGEVEESKLRSIAGCLIEEKDLGRVPELEKKYHVGELPAETYLFVEFPYKGGMSLMLGIFKVYPKLADYMAKKNYAPVPMMEIYDVPAGKIYYIAPVNVKKERFDSFLR